MSQVATARLRDRPTPLLTRIIQEASAASADVRLKRDGRDWREKRDRQELGFHVTRVAFLALVAHHSATSRRTFMNNAG